MKKKTAFILVVSIIIVLVAIRIALPYVIKDYANKKLDEIEGYQGHIDDVDLSIIRGAYVIKGVTLEKTGGKVPIPFFSAARIDLSVEWSALFKGSVVGEIEITNPELNFVAAKSEEQKQTKPGKNWQIR